MPPRPGFLLVMNRSTGLRLVGHTLEEPSPCGPREVGAAVNGSALLGHFASPLATQPPIAAVGGGKTFLAAAAIYAVAAMIFAVHAGVTRSVALEEAT